MCLHSTLNWFLYHQVRGGIVSNLPVHPLHVKVIHKRKFTSSSVLYLGIHTLPINIDIK